MTSWLSQLRTIMSINCEQVAELTSEACDRELLWFEWVAIRAHYLGCWSCRQFEKHLQFLARACTLLGQRERESASASGPNMPLALREKLARLQIEPSADEEL